jgi:hypothetical protein
MHQSLQGATFHIEHVVPKCRDGETSFLNLAWACPSCNLHKSSRIEVPSCEDRDRVVPLFNPRVHPWQEHFDWDDYHLVGQTEIGRATIIALDLNHPRRIRIRQAEQMFGWFPPQPG